MSKIVKAARFAVSVFFGLLTILSVFASVSVVNYYFDRAEKDRGYLELFRAAEKTIDTEARKTEKLPSSLPWYPNILEVQKDGRGCVDDFKIEKDRYVIGYWRGEWRDCYASPSGRHTLRLMAMDHIRSYGWISLMIAAGLVFASGFLTYVIWPKRRRMEVDV
jgi:hypothetical protein